MSGQAAWRRMLGRVRASMHASWLPWYQQRSPREQRLIATATLVCCFGFIAFGIVMPLRHREAAMQQQVTRLADRARQASRLADRLQTGGSVAQADLLAVVEQSAIRSGVRPYMTHIRPQVGLRGGRQLRLRLQAVPYTKLIDFVAALQRRHVDLESLHIQAAGRPGNVHVEAAVSGS